jgi:hypothetical protein
LSFLFFQKQGEKKMMELNEQAAVDTVGGNFWTGLGCGFGIVASIAAPTPLTIVPTIAACGDAIFG